jgi:hypothetical protein
LELAHNARIGTERNIYLSASVALTTLAHATVTLYNICTRTRGALILIYRRTSIAGICNCINSIHRAFLSAMLCLIKLAVWPFKRVFNITLALAKLVFNIALTLAKIAAFFVKLVVSLAWHYFLRYISVTNVLVIITYEISHGALRVVLRVTLRAASAILRAARTPATPTQHPPRRL